MSPSRFARRGLMPLPLLALLLGLGACATQNAYTFRPTGGGSGQDVSGLPASRYLLPAEAPVGEVYVAAPEVHRVESSGEELVHVRLAVSLRAEATAWTVDPAKQILFLPNGQALAPTYMDTPDGNRAVPFQIAPGAQRSLDLFYRMPPGLSIESNVSGFRLSWSVNADARIMAMETPFVREVVPVDEGAGPYVSVGVAAPWWWYRPYGWGPWGPYYGWGWGYGLYGGYGYGGGWGRGGYGRGVHAWPSAGFSGGPRGGGGGGWHGGGGGAVRGAPIRH